MRSAELAEDVARGSLQLAAVEVDQLELPLDAQARPRRGRERNLHQWKVPAKRVRLMGGGWGSGRVPAQRVPLMGGGWGSGRVPAKRVPLMGGGWGGGRVPG